MGSYQYIHGISNHEHGRGHSREREQLEEMGSNDEALSNPILGWEDEEDPTRGPEKENCLKWKENHDVWCEVRKV